MTPKERDMKLLQAILFEDYHDPFRGTQLRNTPAGKTMIPGGGILKNISMHKPGSSRFIDQMIEDHYFYKDFPELRNVDIPDMQLDFKNKEDRKVMGGMLRTLRGSDPGAERRVSRRNMMYDWSKKGPDTNPIASRIPQTLRQTNPDLHKAMSSLAGKVGDPEGRKRHKQLRAAIKRLGKARGIAPLLLLSLIAPLLMGGQGED